VCVCVRARVCMYVCMYVYTYVYIYTGLSASQAQPSFLATAMAGLVNTLSPRAMPATPRGDMVGPSPSPRLGLLLKQDYDGGDVYVGTVVPGGMAARTGAIREGDVVTRVDGCTTAGLSVLAVTELIRAMPLSEPKARARAQDSRCMAEDEVRITLRRQGRPLEAVMPRPPPHLLCSQAHGSSPQHQHLAFGTSSPAHRHTHQGGHTHQGRYNEDAVPLHLRARMGASGAMSERAAPVERSTWNAPESLNQARISSAAAAGAGDVGIGVGRGYTQLASVSPRPGGKAPHTLDSSNTSPASTPRNGADSSSQGGTPRVVPSLLGKGPFMGIYFSQVL